MITNDRQYRITQGWVRKFEASLQDLDEVESHRSPEMRQVMRAAFESQIEDLRDQLAEYDALREGRLESLELDSLEQLGDTLVKARIAAGWTQRQLAEKLGLKEQQIQRYEDRRYEQANLARILEIADELGIEIQARIKLPIRSAASA